MKIAKCKNQSDREELRTGADFRSFILHFAFCILHFLPLHAPGTRLRSASKNAIPARTEAKYGPERAIRYVHLEAGHAAQNVLLQAVALDLGGVPIGAFDDAAVADVVGLRDGEVPLYLLPIGHPR